MEMVSRQSRHPDVGAYMSELGRRACIASCAMACMESVAKDAALAAIANALENESQHLLAENRRNLDAGERNGLDAALLDRLARTDQRVQTMAQGLCEFVVHADPIGEITELKERPSGIPVGKMRVPAIEHIHHTYGSGHTDAIVTEDLARARRFLTEVDSSSVMVNASTRFADGHEYGSGAEIGISTDKLRARAPVGLKGLTSQKFTVLGDGHIRE